MKTSSQVHFSSPASPEPGQHCENGPCEARAINSEVSLAMMQEAHRRGFTVIPALDGDHWFPLAYIVTELLGKSESYFEKEFSRWRRSGVPVPGKHAGANGVYYQLFEFLELYHIWKSQQACSASAIRQEVING